MNILSTNRLVDTFLHSPDQELGLSTKKDNVLVVINPASKHSRLVNMVTSVIDILTKEGRDIKLVKSATDGRLPVDPRNYILVIIAGGDGTVSCYLNRYHGGSYPPIGIIPAGTTNELASSLGITKKNYSEIIRKGSVLRHDLGIINDRKRFCYVAACGAFTDATYNTAQWRKRWLGASAYFFTALRSKPKFKTMELQIEIDDTLRYSGKFIFFAIANSRSFGATIKVQHLPKGWTGDGKFEYFLVRRPRTRLEILRLCVSVLSGRVYDNKNVVSGSCREFSVKSNKDLTLTVDGERFSPSQEVHIAAEPECTIILTGAAVTAGIYR